MVSEEGEARRWRQSARRVDRAAHDDDEIDYHRDDNTAGDSDVDSNDDVEIEANAREKAARCRPHRRRDRFVVDGANDAKRQPTLDAASASGIDDDDDNEHCDNDDE